MHKRTFLWFGRKYAIMVTDRKNTNEFGGIKMEKETFQSMIKKYNHIKLTKKQENILYIISNYIEEEHISPTVREIADIADIKSVATVHQYLKQLEQKGAIKRELGSPRSIKLNMNDNKFNNNELLLQLHMLKEQNKNLKQENQRLKALLIETKELIEKIKTF